MRALVIHEMYEVLRRHSATVRFRARCSSRHNRDDPYFPAAMRHKPSPPLLPHAIPRFVSSFFTLPLVISLLSPLPLSLSPRLPNSPSVSSRARSVVVVCRFAAARRRLSSAPLPSFPRGPVGASRRLYIASGKILRGNTAGLDRNESIREMSLTQTARGRQKKREINLGFEYFLSIPIYHKATYEKSKII